VQAGEAVSPSPLDLSIGRARELIGSGELSPVALAEAALQRIAAADQKLNTFRTVVGESAVTPWVRWRASPSR
jgi:Asp-tRNA(Asn)/Glu-tRNA(Gln) amidotransferase A subunit family amidase